jgi:hypothetical protein
MIGFSLLVATRLLQKLESFDLTELRPGEVKTRRFLHAILNRIKTDPKPTNFCDRLSRVIVYSTRTYSLYWDRYVPGTVGRKKEANKVRWSQNGRPAQMTN